MLPDTSFEQSLVVAERIRNNMRDEPFDIGAEHIQLTVSLGVSCSNEADDVLNDLLKRADEGLYKAKESGRDRVSWVYRPFDSEIHS
jgi:two-component system cell cycle response regulator